MKINSSLGLVLASFAAVWPVHATPSPAGPNDASPVALAPRDGTTAVVNLNNNTGSPQHLASGILYGVPDTADQIPSHFYTDIGLNYIRAGGAQVPAPGRGWIWGLTEYENRFASVLSNYKTARQYSAQFILLIHDLYGCDGTQNSSTPYPGDDGSWTYWDNYLTRLISDLQSNDMLTDLIIDIWNEPDLGTVFWGRTQSQYLEMWGRTYARFRSDLGTGVLLSGPASAGEPLTSNSWWTTWAQFVKSNDSVPDQYAWHMEGGGGDMLSAYGGLLSILKTYDLPEKTVNVNEYSTYAEQVPSASAWWIAQLERVNAHGLRGNWLSGWQLHDFMASLLGKTGMPSSYSETGTGYYPNGDYQVYRYYYQNMTGHRVGTSPSSDLIMDVYGTVGSDNTVRLLVGGRIETGTWYITVNSLSSVGFATSGTVNIRTWQFNAEGYYTEVDGPTDLGYYGHTYSGNTVTFPIYQTTANTTWAFEFIA